MELQRSALPPEPIRLWAVPHPAVSDCAVDQARNVYRAGEGAIIRRFDRAQRDC